MSEFKPIPGVAVIGFGHKARHGKDTAVGAIVQAYPKDAMRFSFADDLYAYCRVVHGMTKKDPVLLQKVGVELREKDPDVWVKSVYAKILDAKPALALISDVRFPNEMAFVQALGGTCVRVQRLRPNGELYRDPSRPADHISEIALDNAPGWGITLTAKDGEIAKLQQRARSLVPMLTDIQYDPMNDLDLLRNAQSLRSLTPPTLNAQGFRT